MILQYDLDKYRKYSSPISQKVKQGDTLKLKFNIYENGISKNLTGYSADLRWINADNTFVNIGSTKVTIGENLVTVECDNNCTKAPGTCKFELHLHSSLEEDYSFTQEVNVLESVVQGQEVAKNVSNILDDLNDTNNKAEEFVKKNTDIANLSERTTTNENEISQLKQTSATKETTNNIQQQVNNLVLGAVGDGQNAEIIQARGEYNTLNDRLNRQKQILVEQDARNYYKTRNMFNGEFVHGYKIAGDSNLMKDNDYYCAILPIEPNTSYTYFMPSVIDKEDGYYWFKIASTPKTFEEIKEDIKTYSVCNLTGGVHYNNTSQYVRRHNFTTGANDKTIVIMVSKYQKPYIEVLKGTFTRSLYSSYENMYEVKEVKCNSKDIYINPLIADTTYRICFGDYQTDLTRIVNSTSNSDLWNLVGIFQGDIAIVNTGTDIIGPIKEVGASDFIGGMHGDEKNTKLFITCDGIEWNKTSIKTCRELKVIMASEIYRESDKSHIYDRNVEITFTYNKIRIRNRYKCLVNDSVIERATNGGLIAIDNTLLKGVSMPNFLSSVAPTQAINNAHKDNYEGTLFWKNGSISVRNLIGKERDTFSGFLNVFTNENPIRNKIYLDVIKATSQGTLIKQNETILGEFEYIFN